MGRVLVPKHGGRQHQDEPREPPGRGVEPAGAERGVVGGLVERGEQVHDDDAVRDGGRHRPRGAERAPQQPPRGHDERGVRGREREPRLVPRSTNPARRSRPMTSRMTSEGRTTSSRVSAAPISVDASAADPIARASSTRRRPESRAMSLAGRPGSAGVPPASTTVGLRPASAIAWSAASRSLQMPRASGPLQPLPGARASRSLEHLWACGPLAGGTPRAPGTPRPCSRACCAEPKRLLAGRGVPISRLGVRDRRRSRTLHAHHFMRTPTLHHCEATTRFHFRVQSFMSNADMSM